MSNNKNIQAFFEKKPNIEFLVKVICALCISTLVILIIISCARGAKAGLAESRSKTEFRTNVSPLASGRHISELNNTILITKKQL